MIRAETDTDWLLVTHPDHAFLAGQLADAWGNLNFATPELFEPIRYAVYHHDDGWLPRDTAPHLTPGGKPEGFTSELVGAYSAFEEIDLPAYLAVRERATAEVAKTDPIAAVIVSMHTVNLLTEQADLSSIRSIHRSAHADFIDRQITWQNTTIASHRIDPSLMQRGFEFLQCCDNLSLIACSGYAESRPLRHAQPDRQGHPQIINCRPASDLEWTLSPWPFCKAEISFSLPRRRLSKSVTHSLKSFRDSFAATQPEVLRLTFRAA